MKLLILTQWYFPEYHHKFLSDLAQCLQSFGHDVQVLTGFPNYPSGKLYPGYRLCLWQREIIDNIQVTRVILYPDHSRSVLKRGLNYLSFALSAAILGPWLIKRPDVIFVYGSPLTVALPAWIMSFLWRVPFVFNIQDIWPETLQATGMVSNSLVLNVVGWFAKWVYHTAAAIIVISPGFCRNLIGKGVPASKVYEVSNWVDIYHYRPVEVDIESSKQLGLSGYFNVMFAGGIGRAQELDTVLECAHLVGDISNLQFVFVGDGVDLPRLKDRANSMKLKNVRFLGAYPEEDMPALLSLADVLLVHLKDEPLFRLTIPHKVFAYMASGKPVLAAVAGDAAEIITSAGAGLACPPSNPAALAEAIRYLYNLSPAERARMAENGRRVACRQYSCQSQARRIARILESVVARAY